MSSVISKGPAAVILDASEKKVVGEGEWKVYGWGRLKWLKAHVAIDLETQEIVAKVTTESSVPNGIEAEDLYMTDKRRDPASSGRWNL